MRSGGNEAMIWVCVCFLKRTQVLQLLITVLNKDFNRKMQNSDLISRVIS